jgi:predicted ATPase
VSKAPSRPSPLGRDFSYALLRGVAGIEDTPLRLALDRLADADVPLVRGLPPESDYRFKHALIQDAAYENLLKSRRQVLHRHVAETLRDRFPARAAAEPELLAHHFAQAGFSEAAIEWWGKAGQRSLERSALAEAVEQFTRAVSQIATAPPTPMLRREEIRLQVALIHPLIHLKGHAAPETKVAAERARLLIEQAEALGESPGDPLLLLSALGGLAAASFVAFDGDAVRQLAARFMTLARKQGGTTPLMLGHFFVSSAFLYTGDILKGRTHLDRAIALYDPAEHRALATRFATNPGVHALCYRAWANLLGYPEAALSDASRALCHARQIGQTSVLMNTLGVTCVSHILRRDYATAAIQIDELVTLADETGSSYWKALAMLHRGGILVATDRVSEGIEMIVSWLPARRSTGSTSFIPLWSLYLTNAHAQLGRLDEAQHYIDEAIAAVQRTKEKFCEAEVHRVAGEVALKSSGTSAAKAETYFERALAIARKQQAKSWELRAAMSMARLWRDQGKPDEARDLLAPVYGWFIEGFDTLDLKEAKNLLDALAS